jgi:hypothetical protein
MPSFSSERMLVGYRAETSGGKEELKVPMSILTLPKRLWGERQLAEDLEVRIGRSRTEEK